MNVIEIRNLTKNYGRSRGVKNLNLSVEEGEFFGFIGPNGAGKSTTIRTLLGLIFPSEGEAVLLNKPIGNKNTLARIGYMPSEALFYENMKVGDVISYSAKLYRKNCAKEAKTLCDRLQLDTSKKISELSLGNRKKVGIVCAMQHQPELYILDEPTSGLDPLMQKEFFDLLSEKNKEGAAVFLSSHILTEIQKHCNRAAIIREGEIIVCDSVENLSRSKAKRVIVSGITSVPEGIQAKSVSQTAGNVSFLYSGDICELLKIISGLPIDDITITEPDLEEIFMHYYQK